jgi:hypothetical protein
MKEGEMMSKAYQLANDLWQNVITMDEFNAGMEKLNVETDNSAPERNRVWRRPNPTSQPRDYAAEAAMADLKRRAGIITENDTPQMLVSRGAQSVIDDAMNIIQNLDEIGGSESRSDYINAMNILIRELTKRRNTAAHMLKTDGDNPG